MARNSLNWSQYGRQILCGLLALALGAAAQGGEIRYPRVYGFTGRPYGPTQAHYQYQRQYGRPWHGYGGQRLQVNHGIVGGYARSGFGGGCFSDPGWGLSETSFVTGYGLSGVSTFGIAGAYPGTYAGTVWSSSGLPLGLGYGGVYAPQAYGYYSVGPTYQFHAGPTVVYRGALPDWNPPAIDHPAMERFQAEEIQRWQQPVDVALSASVKPQIPESTAAARLKCLESQLDGDAAFRRQDFHKAYAHYRQATLAANDQAAPHFRMGFTLAGLRRFEKAAEYFRLGLLRDPDWPLTGEPIRMLYGPDNEIVRTLHLRQVTAWVREDIRDPDRLFVLGVMLHFDGRPEEAAVCFETALRLAGGGDHLKLFLQVDPTLLAAHGPAQPDINNQAAPLKNPRPGTDEQPQDVDARNPADDPPAAAPWRPAVPPPPAPGDVTEEAHDGARPEPFRFRGGEPGTLREGSN